MTEQKQKLLDTLAQEISELSDEEFMKGIERLDKIFKSGQVQVQVSDGGNNKIRWFMELALKMKERNYSDMSIYTIDIDAWDKYRVDDEYTPEQAISEDESNA